MYFIFPCKLVILYLGLEEDLKLQEMCQELFCTRNYISVFLYLAVFFFFGPKLLLEPENLYEVRNVISL